MRGWYRQSGPLLCVLFLASAALGEEQPAAPKSRLNVPLSPEAVESFAHVMKGILLQKLPPSPTFEQYRNWGHQVNVPTLHGVHVVKVPRNHGSWQHVRAVCPNLAQSLELRLHDLRVLNGEKVLFKLHLALPTTVEFEQQNWQNGLRVFNGHGRARLRILADLDLESDIKLDTKGELLPEVVIRFKIADAHVSYDKLVVEHLGPVGGDTARILGEALHKAVHQFKPKLEQDLMEKARTAILKAGEAREVHLSLAKLLHAKPGPTK